MSDKLKGLFGGGEAAEPDHASGAGHADDREARRAERRAERQKQRDLTDDEHDFVNRYTAGSPSEGFSTEEAVNYLQRVRGEVPPEVMQRAAVSAVQNLPADQRKQFAEMLERRQQGSGMVTIERTGQAGAAQGRGGGDAGGDMNDVLGGLFGSLMGGGMAQSAPQPTPQSGPQGGGMDDMLGGLLGSLLGGGAAPAPQSQANDPFGDILGGLLGGAPQPAPQHQTPQAQQQPAGGGIGDILGSPWGKAVLGGIAAYAMKEMMGGDKKR